MRLPRLSIGFLALAFAALIHLTACGRATRVPADQLAPVDEALRQRIHAHADALANSVAHGRPALESTLAAIGREHGESSQAMVQALSDAAVMLVSDVGNATDAVPYFRRALEAAEKFYGHEHRETAFLLHDYGEIQVLAAQDAYVPAATPLYEESLAVRRRVLGERHPETAGSARSLARQLLRACEAEPPCRPADARLVEALRLAKHALDVFEKEGRDKPLDAGSATELVGRIIAKRGASPAP